MNRDPVSGNDVPPGATAREVRDDVPIMASENEYIIPADVVRFLGLDKIEKMVEQAKMKLEELDQKGRIGGDTGEEDSLPFDPEELQAVESPDEAIPQMAQGGMVTTPQDQNSQVDPVTGLPLWLVNMQGGTQPAAPQPTPVVQPPTVAKPAVQKPMGYQSSSRESDRDRDFKVNLTGTAQSVSKWTPAEFNKYARTRGNTGQAVGSAAASLVPFGAMGAKIRGNYLEKAVPRGFDDMLKTGKDLQGNALSKEDMDQLRSSYARVKSTRKPKTGPMSALKGMATDSGLVKRREKTESSERPQRRLRDLFKRKDSSADKDKEGLVSRPTKSTKKTESSKTTTTKAKTSSKKDDKKK